LISLLTLNVLLEISEVVQIAPTIRLLEDAICRQYYRSSGELGALEEVHEMMCKIEVVQAHLACVRGWLGFFDAIPILCFGFVFGQLADRYGRKVIFSASVIGITLQMAWIYFTAYYWAYVPIQMVWFSSIFRLIGGGPHMALSMLMTMSADRATDETRSRAFYRTFSVYLTTDLIGPQLAYIALGHSLWLPYLICGLSLALTFPVLYAMPSTMPAQKAQVFQDKSPFGVTSYKGYTSFLKNWRILLGLMTLFVAQFRWIAIDILLPYTSMTFGWSIGKTNLLISIVSAVNIFTFLLFLPYVTMVLQERSHVPIAVIDLFVTRASSTLLAIGLALMTLAWSPALLIFALVIYAGGFGTRASMLSVITGFIDPSQETARLYTLVSMAEAVAHMLGSPFVEHVWASGIRLGGQWMILPFVVL
ncbi:MFS general substrate transporter, partial [Patellaria atrata CBS 101060]